MLEPLRRLYSRTVTLDYEARKVLEFTSCVCAGRVQECKVLEVGCGRGRYLRMLSGIGFDVTGVDANPELVRANRDAGLHCLTTDEFARSAENYDVVLMSHIIEHFTPQALVPFMDRYLDRLKPGGWLVIATPLWTRFFYDDFDHVKPYNPIGFLMVFGEDRAQVQYYARNKLRLEDIWIRRGHWRFAHRRSRYLRSTVWRLLQLLEFGSAIAFRLSAGVIGQANGWVGLFQKVVR
jgi:SAM-dependent methyltransferase